MAPTWEDDTAAEVNGLRGAGEGSEDVDRGAHGHDAVAGNGDSAIPKDAESAVHGDDNRVVKDQINLRRAAHLRGLSSARRRRASV